VGALRLGAIYTVGPHLLPRLVPRLRVLAPRMPLVIEENFTAALLEQLRDNQLDIVVVALPVDLQGLSALALYDEEFVVALPPDHRWASELSIPAKKLAEENLLLLGAGHCFRDQVIAACPKCVDAEGSGPKPHTGSSLETIRYMVASGLGITVLPRGSMEIHAADTDALISVPIAEPAPSRRVGLVWRKSFPRLAAVQAVRDAVFDCGLRGIKMITEGAAVVG
jgi:LysR family hydrogen peroxide-inducible transcriptional activator